MDRRPGHTAVLVAATPKDGPVAGTPSPAPERLPAITPQTVAQIVESRAVATGFGFRDLGGHSLRRGALTTATERGAQTAKLKRLGRHKSFAMLGEYLEFGDLFEGPTLSGVP